jgi:hypothetical protein
MTCTWESMFLGEIPTVVVNGMYVDIRNPIILFCFILVIYLLLFITIFSFHFSYSF